jgi:hypothetical protein
MKSGNLNFLEPCGPLQACNGTALLLSLFRRNLSPPCLWSMFIICLTLKMIWPLSRATVSHCLARNRGSYDTFRFCTCPFPTACYSNLRIYAAGSSATLVSTVEFHLSGLTGTASHPDMQKIRIIGFFFENRLHWRFEVGKKFLQTAILGYILFTYK